MTRGQGAIALGLLGGLLLGCAMGHPIRAAVEQNAPLVKETAPLTLNSEKTAALERRIRQIRMADVVIRVVDGRNRPMVGAQVQLTQTRHAFEFGTALSSEMFSPTANPAEQRNYWDTAKRLFNASVHENALKWYATEVERGKVSYEEADRILAWSQRQQMPMRGHTLFWEVERWQNPWAKRLSKGELRMAVQQRTLEVCRRYRGKIGEYDVLNEMLHGNFFRQRLGDGIVKEMFQWCQQADPAARLYVNDYNILTGQELDRYVQQIRTLQKQGVPIGGIGIQAHIREPLTPQQIQRSLDTLAQFRLPLKLTEVSVVAHTPEQQAQVLTDILRIAFAHPSITGIYQWGFWAGAHWEPKSALFRKNWQPTPAAIAYQTLVFKDWWTRAQGQTNAQGQWQQRGFLGQYTAIVRFQNRTVQTQFTLTPSPSQPITLTLPD
jgi:endo-1,4-beta-xylanase